MSKKLRACLPVKSSATGHTLALMCQEGIALYCRSTRDWEVHSIDEILRIYEEVTKMAENTTTQDKTA